MSIYQTCPKCGLSTSECGNVCDLCIQEAAELKLKTCQECLQKMIKAARFLLDEYDEAQWREPEYRLQSVLAEVDAALDALEGK